MDDGDHGESRPRRYPVDEYAGLPSFSEDDNESSETDRLVAQTPMEVLADAHLRSPSSKKRKYNEIPSERGSSGQAATPPRAVAALPSGPPVSPGATIKPVGRFTSPACSPAQAGLQAARTATNNAMLEQARLVHYHINTTGV